MSLPELITQHDHVLRVLTFGRIRWQQSTPQQSRHAKMDESVGGEIHSLDILWKIAFRRGEAPPLHGGRALDRGGRPKLLQLRPIEIYIAAVAVSVVDHQVNHPVRISVRIRIHQDAVNHAEHSCCGADAQRQRQDGNNCESRILQQHPHSITRIISDVSQPYPSPNVPRDLLHQSHIPKLPPRRAFRILYILTLFRALPRRHLQMGPQFLVKVCFSPLTSPETHRPPHHFLCAYFLTSLLPYFIASALDSTRPRSRPKAAPTSIVPWSIVSFQRPSVGKTLPAACSRRFPIPL